MRDVKFICTSCGQHVQCDESHSGEKIPCPNCATVIRVPVDAELVLPTPSPANPLANEIVPTLEDNILLTEAGAPVKTEVPLTEREQQIAAARAAHAAQQHAIKPRLSYILSGGEAPPPEENHAAVSDAGPATEEHKAEETHSLSE